LSGKEAVVLTLRVLYRAGFKENAGTQIAYHAKIVEMRGVGSVTRKEACTWSV